MTGSTTFGFGMITAQRDPRDPRTHTDIYSDVLDLSETAERLGFDALWLSEHHFVDDGYMPSLLPVSAAIAARTQRIQIATGILVAPLHDPVRLAEDAATVDLLSGGRLLLGLGAGYRDEEFAGLGRTKAGLGAVMDATIATLRNAWSDGTVQSGPQTPRVKVMPKPHRPGGPPIWIGARTQPGMRRVARVADGLLAARVTPAEFAEQVGFLGAALDEVGRPRSEMSVGVHCPVFAWPDASAWERVEPHLHYVEWKYKDMVGEPYGRRSGPAGAPSDLKDDVRRTLRAGALVGSPAEVAETVAAYADGAGDAPFHFIPRLYWPGMDPALQREAMAVFAEEVIPAFVEEAPCTSV